MIKRETQGKTVKRFEQAHGIGKDWASAYGEKRLKPTRPRFIPGWLMNICKRPHRG